MQIKRVLVPIDFSPPSRLALNYGIRFARQFQARLILLHVVELSDAVTFSEAAGIEREHHEQSRRMLSALIAQEDQEKLDLSFVVKSGAVEDELLSTIQDDRVDVVIMGTHGRGLVGRWLIGSATQRVLRDANIPVLTVCRLTNRPAFERILFATDLSVPSNERVRAALDLAKAMRADLIATHSVEVGVEGGAEAAVYLTPGLLEDARARMDAFKEEAARKNVKFEAVLTEGAAAEAIIKTAVQKAADLIVIAIRKDELGRNILGSTAEDIIRQAHIPVMAVPVGWMNA